MFSFLRRLRRSPVAPPAPTLVPTPPVDASTLAAQTSESAAWPHQPLISILVPVYRPPLDVLRAAVDSVLAQSYPRWELCLVHTSAEPSDVRSYLASLTDPRIRQQELPDNLGISGNSNAALALATGDYVTLLDHDDALSPDALYHVAHAIHQRPHLDVIYSDKDSFGINNVLKPQWSPELLWSSSYITHLSVLRTSLVRDVDGFRTECDGAQDWDLFLRAITRSAAVHRIPRILYHWRIIEGSTSVSLSAKPYAAAAQLRAVSDHLARLGLAAQAVFDQQQQIRIRWEQPERQSVSILLIGGDETRAKDLRQRTRYAAYETVPVPDKTPAAIQQAFRATTGECLVLLDRNVRPMHEAWLQDLVPPLQHDAIGAVTPLLLDPYTHRIRHAGFAFGRNGELFSLAANEPVGRNGHLGRNDWYRNCSALSAACLAVRRDAFEAAGGFVDTPWHPRPDVDLCLRIQYRAGLRLLVNPAAQCEQSRPAWCDRDVPNPPALFPDGDPYFHPALDPASAPPTTNSRIDHLYPELARADELLRTARVRSSFETDGVIPPEMWRRRIAEWFPRLAADASITHPQKISS